MNEGIDLSIFDPEFVRAMAIRQLKELEDRHNFNRKQSFLLAVENWKRNAPRLAALKQSIPPIPEPPLALHYRYLDGAEPEVKEGPDLVAERYVPPVPTERPSGVVEFGPPLEDDSGGFAVGSSNTVPPGTLARKDGKEYVFIMIGRPGSINYRKHWMPTGN